MSPCREEQPCCCHCQHGVSTDEACARCTDLVRSLNRTQERAWIDAAAIAHEWHGDDEATVELLALVWRWQTEAYSPYLNLLADALASAWGNPIRPEKRH